MPLSKCAAFLLLLSVISLTTSQAFTLHNDQDSLLDNILRPVWIGNRKVMLPSNLATQFAPNNPAAYNPETVTPNINDNTVGLPAQEQNLWVPIMQALVRMFKKLMELPKKLFVYWPIKYGKRLLHFMALAVKAAENIGHPGYQQYY